jgi:hypothetical protein
LTTKLRNIKLVLYRLKRDYGLRIHFYQLTSNEQDIITGRITRTYTILQIKRAIRLPKRLLRQYVFDIMEGGYYDTKDCFIIIDSVDISIEPTLDDHCEFENQRYEIKAVKKFEDNRGYILQLVQHTAALAVGFIPTNTVAFEQTAVGVV